MEHTDTHKTSTAVLEKKLCTGCGSCAVVCPHKSIEMKNDEEGFLIPFFDTKTCTNCALCVSHCHVLNSSYSNSQNPIAFSAYAQDEIRKESSSGGLFTVLANHILDVGGTVCGAAFSQDWSVEHILVSNKDDLWKLRGSKYVDSVLFPILKDIKKTLEKGNYVLFSGCPCQVSALNRYLDKNYENLYTIDIICHGVPSPKAWHSYLEQNFNKDTIKNISFRSNKTGWANLSFKAEMYNGDIVSQQCASNTFYSAYVEKLLLRKSCESCKFATIPRQGDITIGDFWGVHSYNPSFDDNKGLSIALINNSKGESLYNKIEAELQLNEAVPSIFAINSQRNILNPSTSHANRDLFFAEFTKDSSACFNDLVSKYL